MDLVPGSSEDEPRPRGSPGFWHPESPRQTNPLWKDREETDRDEGHQDVQVLSQKTRLPSIVVEASDVSEESGELQWPQELLLLNDGKEEAKVVFQDQTEEPDWTWKPVEPTSPLRTVSLELHWGQELVEQDASWIPRDTACQEAPNLNLLWDPTGFCGCRSQSVEYPHIPPPRGFEDEKDEFRG